MSPTQTPSKVRSRKGGFEGHAETNLQVLSFEITEVLSFQFTVISVYGTINQIVWGHSRWDACCWEKAQLGFYCPVFGNTVCSYYICWNTLPEKWQVWENTLENQHSRRILRSWQQQEHISKQPDWNSSKLGRGSGLPRGLWHHLHEHRGLWGGGQEWDFHYKIRDFLERSIVKHNILSIAPTNFSITSNYYYFCITPLFIFCLHKIKRSHNAFIFKS